MKHLLVSPLSLALALAACEISCGVRAAERLAGPPEFLSAQAGATAADVRWQAVGDDVLSHQTGRAPGASMVSGFVLDLMSRWQMPDGGSASAHGKLTVSTRADDSLSAQVSTSAQASDGNGHGNHYGNDNHYGNGIGNGIGNTNGKGASALASAGTGANPQASATGGQNVSVSGVSQITQVAGNGNTGTNSAVIDFGSASPSPLSGSGAPSMSSTSATSSTSNPTATATSASGNVKAGVTFGNGGVALTLQTPAGVATQTITPSVAQGSGSVAQLLQVAGNAQAVINQLQLSIQTQPMSGALLRQLGVLQALQNSALPRR